MRRTGGHCSLYLYRNFAAQPAGTFWAVVLNGLLAEQPEQPLPWLGAWPSAAVLG